MKHHTDTAPMFVYAICDPREADPINSMRYVGVCDDTDARLRRHLLSARNGSSHRVHVWMGELGEMLPLVMVLGTVSRDLAASAERIAIGFWRAAGAELLNDTDGGEGFLTTEQRGRLAAAWRDPAKRSRLLAASRKSMPKAHAATRAAWRDPAKRPRFLKAARKNGAKAHAATRAAWANDDAYRAKMTEAVRRGRVTQWANDAYRAKMTEALRRGRLTQANSPDYRAKMTEAARKGGRATAARRAAREV